MRIPPLALLLPLLASAAPPAAPDLPVEAPARPAEAAAARPTLFVAGDSTAARGDGKATQGWGTAIADYFDPARVTVANHARGGRSSRTFLTEGLWDRLLTAVKPGDVVLIQFGHNDADDINERPPGSTKPVRARGSLPGLGDESREIVNILTGRPETVRTYGWYVRRMVADVRARGATPVLLSLTIRNLWSDGRVERGSGRYREWTRALARELGAPFVDVTRIVADEYQELGPGRTGELYAGDHTHTNPAGADLHARAVVAGLKGLRPPIGADWLSERGAAVAADPIGWLDLPEPADPRLPTLLLVGDSTVRNGRGDGAGGQWGWGEPLAELVDPRRLNVVNRAVGGLSSRTFRTQGHWARALAFVRPGDHVVVQFGHNDSSPVNDDRRARGTLRGVGDEKEDIVNRLTGQPETVRTYGWYLRQYVREARAAGARVTVCSPVPRKRWAEGRIARTADSHAAWARQVAAEEGVDFLDLEERVSARYEALGPAAVEAFFADEHTHTSRAGAALTAALVAEALDLPRIAAP